MHPVARVFQIILLAGGVFLAGFGYVMYYSDFQQSTTVRATWDCRVVKDTQKCTISSGSLNPGNRDEATMAIAFGGVLVLAGGVVAVGGRRSETKAGPMVQPTYAGAPGGPKLY